MMKETFTSKRVPSVFPFISHAVRYGNMVFVCGLGPKNLAGDIRKQTAETIEHIRLVLEDAGTSLDKVLKMVVYLSDMKNYQAMNEQYATVFQTNPPVRTCIQALTLPASKGQLVEMDAIAAVQ
jgi:2-iminobutanoate/2-iminopropanoate deaminase